MRVLITGGAGFIGSNAADFFGAQGHEVVVLDNFSRETGRNNVEWLRSRNPEVAIHELDLRNANSVEKIFHSFAPDWVLHLGAQVAVTSSVIDPRHDFEVNALGTLNVLEALRKHTPEAKLIFASTNKVYGSLADLPVVEGRLRMEVEGIHGINETYPLDFYSPYGCSKGAADQYVVDFGRIYELQTLSVRQSCIYGPRQYGLEDQGWMSWFALRGLRGRPVTIFGNGKQVRDVLHVDDLIRLYHAVFLKESWEVNVINAGGGIGNSLSLLEYLELLESSFGITVDVGFDSIRPGDQHWFVSDNSRAKKAFSWAPRVSIRDGLDSMVTWSREFAA